MGEDAVKQKQRRARQRTLRRLVQSWGEKRVQRQVGCPVDFYIPIINTYFRADVLPFQDRDRKVLEEYRALIGSGYHIILHLYPDDTTENPEITEV